MRGIIQVAQAAAFSFKLLYVITFPLMNSFAFFYMAFVLHGYAVSIENFIADFHVARAYNFKAAAFYRDIFLEYEGGQQKGVFNFITEVKRSLGAFNK